MNLTILIAWVQFGALEVKNIEEYFFLKKISISLLKYLTKKLNRIHKKKENKKY